MVTFTSALILAFIHATVALPSSASLDGMSTPSSGCCLLSPDSDVVYESTCKKLSSYQGVDSYSCPDLGEIEYKYNEADPTHSQIRLSPNVGIKDGLYVHGWCIEEHKPSMQTAVAYCPAPAASVEPSTQPFMQDFQGCENPDFKVVKYLGHKTCANA